MNLTDKQLHILLHSLGLTQPFVTESYRNRFITGPGSADWIDCRWLCDVGLMKDFGVQRMMGGDHLLTVTPEGIQIAEAMRPKPKKLTKGQQRYRNFLNLDSGMTFREFLKCKDSK